MKKSILVVCIHNSARSQMAEAYFNTLGGDLFEAESAGIEPGKLNPHVVKVLREDHIDISSKQTQSTEDLYSRGRSFSYVLTVCDPEAAERCPLFPGTEKRMHWPFNDPSGFKGSDEEKLAGTRVIRDQIKEKVNQFIEEYRKDPQMALDRF